MSNASWFGNSVVLQTDAYFRFSQEEGEKGALIVSQLSCPHLLLVTGLVARKVIIVKECIQTFAGSSLSGKVGETMCLEIRFEEQKTKGLNTEWAGSGVPVNQWQGDLRDPGGANTETWKRDLVSSKSFSAWVKKNYRIVGRVARFIFPLCHSLNTSGVNNKGLADPTVQVKACRAPNKHEYFLL